MKINNYAVNQADKGTVIYDVNDQVSSVCIVLKGRVQAVNNGSKVILGSGNFIGVSDLFYMGRYLNSYIAYDDVTFYCFSVQLKEDLAEIFASNKDYKGLMVASLTRQINEMDKIYSALLSTAEQLYDFINQNYQTYLDTGKRYGYPTTAIDTIQNMEHHSSESIIDEKKLIYYKECANISLDTWKAFCSTGDGVTIYLVEETAGIIVQLTEECKELSAYISDIFGQLMNNTDICLFKGFAALAISIEESGGYNNELVHIIDEIIDQINHIEKLFEEKIGRTINVDRVRMEEIYYMLLSKNSSRKEQVENNFQYSQSEMQQMTEDLNNSLKQIQRYGNRDADKAEELEHLMLDFINLKDKYSTDDNVRGLRRKITQHYYELYEAVFFKSCDDKAIPRIIDLFLKFGFLDERLLTKEQLKELYNLTDEVPGETGPCMVYNIKDWLTSIYKGEKEPSKNEFDLDYTDMLRERRKKNEITEIQGKELLLNQKEKVIYEISNMFRYNHRVVSGQIITFVPFIWSDNMVKGIQKLRVTSKIINTAINELLEIDYSVFHREVLYVNKEKRIAKEYILKQVFPDILLMPAFGYNGVMWQEITGKRKSNEGRFVLPAFSEIAIKDILVKMLGRFRWELCRSIQGSAWNNIKYKSLTSEYADYIQFYRKNRDLSEEVKEKVKSQIQKGKGNYREIFVIDYEAWIKGEATGALRLNKVAREMFATYCPFGKPIRDRIKGQPLFADAMERFSRNTLKKKKELELRYRAIEKEGGELTEELMETFIFYRDL
ncbi:MAG: cyclic nucleotide-binding domain-containing protein [Anaerocolumna sp.]